MNLDNPYDFYDAIAQELNILFSESWLKVQVDVRRVDDYLDIQTVYKLPDGTTESDIYSAELGEYFFDLAKVVSDQGKGLYTSCTFVLYGDGKFTVAFQY